MIIRALALIASVWIFAGLDSGCGGGGSSIPPPQADFRLLVNPPVVFTAVGTTSPPSVILASDQNGFTGTVTVAISGLPSGASSSPASPFVVPLGTTAEVRFSIPVSAQTGAFSLQFSATSGQLSKSATLALNVTPAPIIQTYQSGPMLFMEADSGSEVARVGLLTTWGGSITEVSLNGLNFVNANDPGREVQPELWDGNTPALSDPAFWGTVLAGDHDYNGSPVLTQTLAPDSIYIKTQPLHWIPEDFGGGPGNPVPSDVYIEQWLAPVPGYWRAFKLHYKITHFGSDTHANVGQEYPAVYLNRGFDTFVYYGGTNPWTYGALSTFSMPDLPQQGPLLYTPEEWAAYEDANNSGLTVYTPGSFPWTHGFNAAGDSPNGTNYFVPVTPFTFNPGAVLESNIYLVAGPVTEARAIIYALREEEVNPSPFTALGNLEVPQTGDTLSGTKAEVGGWTFGTSPVKNVQVLVDGILVGTATYGTSRPDIPANFPNEPDTNVGFDYFLDTTGFANGTHGSAVRVTDGNGNVAVLPTAQVTINNINNPP
jgi:hypothetical protein